RFVDRLGIEPPRLDVTGDSPDATDDLIAAAVVESEDQLQRAVGGGQLLGLPDHPQDVGGQSFAPADDGDPDAPSVQVGDVAIDVEAEQAEQEVDLGWRPRPVLR